MQSSGIIVEFPTGRRLQRASPMSSIARLVRSLSGGREEIDRAAVLAQPLPIRLDLLTGMDDETIGGLAALAVSGVITSDSAARFALRHAAEATGGRTNLPDVSIDRMKHRRIVMTCAGDVFGKFGLLLRMEEVWVGFAYPSCLGLLYEICPVDPGSICLLVGCDAGSRNTIRVLASRDWRRQLATLREERLRSAHHLLVLGGIPTAGHAKSSTLIELRNAVRASGSIIVGSGRVGGPAFGRHRVQTNLGRKLLTLIELVMPGLVDVEQNKGDNVR